VSEDRCVGVQRHELRTTEGSRNHSCTKPSRGDRAGNVPSPKPQRGASTLYVEGQMSVGSERNREYLRSSSEEEHPVCAMGFGNVPRPG
jgi:hypothetical protein